MSEGSGMGSRRFALLLLACVALTLPAWADSPHPALARVDGSLCATCHEDLLEEAVATHPPAADDCTSCHEMEVGEQETRVSLMAGEPDLCVMCHDDLDKAAWGS